MGLRSLDDSQQGISAFIKRNPTTNFVATYNGEIVGTILCGHDGRRGYIYHTVVKEGHRNQGIATKLIEAAVSALQQEGCGKAIDVGTLYVYEDNNGIAGSMIVNKVQSAEYTKIIWEQTFANDEAMVIHLLMVRPSKAGQGIATSLVRYATELAENSSCKALRLDTGSQNIPALSLYKKLGFQVVATASMNVGSVIEHSGHLFLEKLL